MVSPPRDEAMSDDQNDLHNRVTTRIDCRDPAPNDKCGPRFALSGIIAHAQQPSRHGAVFNISSSFVTVRQLRAVVSTPRSRSARSASLDVPNPRGV